MLHTQRLPFWRTVHADIARLREEDPGVRTLVRGMLSQGFHALLVYRIFRWCYERHIPTQPLRFFVERFIEIITGIFLPAQAQIGKGLRIHHFGSGDWRGLYHLSWSDLRRPRWMGRRFSHWQSSAYRSRGQIARRGHHW